MDLARPHRDLGMGATGDVLMALLALAAPLSGRQIAERASRSSAQVSVVLGELIEAGLVVAQSTPPSIRYQLNRAHVLVPAIEAIAASKAIWREQLAELVAFWRIAPEAVVIFGSAATGVGGRDSDIDILVLRSREVDASDAVWREQVLSLRERLAMWTGNDVEVLELTSAGLRRNARLRREVASDGIVVSGTMPRTGR